MEKSEDRVLDCLVWLGRATAVLPVAQKDQGYAVSVWYKVYAYAYTALVTILGILFLLDNLTLSIAVIDYLGNVANWISGGNIAYFHVYKPPFLILQKKVRKLYSYYIQAQSFPQFLGIVANWISGGKIGSLVRY